jgi:tRNA(fMet)-specific endonuclease VapC
MKYLLDSNTCIGLLNGPSEALEARRKQTPVSRIRVCSVVKAELLYGAEKSRKSERTKQQLLIFFAKFNSMPFDDKAAQVYAEIRAGLEREGKLIGPNDLLIAAIAVANELTLVTHNTAEFSRVPGLQIEDWEA